MQKVKDRKQKLEDRKETKHAELERIEQAEQQKQELLAETHGLHDGSNDDGPNGDESDNPVEHRNDTTTTTKTYEDTTTQSQFGGQVIVTTTTVLPSDDDDDNDDESDNDRTRVSSKKHHHHDEQQRYAGKVDRFLHELKGKMPAKRKEHSHHHVKHKGKHGAASMSGMGGLSNFKLAQKALSKIQAKQARPTPFNKKTRKSSKHKR
jgi:hypothetical protein